MSQTLAVVLSALGRRFLCVSHTFSNPRYPGIRVPILIDSWKHSQQTEERGTRSTRNFVTLANQLTVTALRCRRNCRKYAQQLTGASMSTLPLSRSPQIPHVEPTNTYAIVFEPPTSPGSSLPSLPLPQLERRPQPSASKSTPSVGCVI